MATVAPHEKFAKPWSARRLCLRVRLRETSVRWVWQMP